MNPSEPHPVTNNLGAGNSAWNHLRQKGLIAVVLLLTFLAFLPSLQNGFVNLDDQVNIYKNPHILNITDWSSFLDSLVAIFSQPVVGNYNPLPIASFAIEKMLFGLDNPAWFHLNNILLHLLCTFLVFRIALALHLDLLPAAFCALLFGIHPMRVESVAWITERKDVLFGTFFLLAFYFYIKRVRSSLGRRHQAIILVSFVLALLAKIQAVALPLSMLLVDYYFDRRLSLKLIYEKWHYFSLSLLTGLADIYFIKMEVGVEGFAVRPLFERIFIGAYSYVVYVIKSLVPYKLVPIYAYPAELPWEFYASIVPALGLLALGLYCFKKGMKVPVFGLLFFTFNIMFLLQIFSAGQGFLSDRFTYIAYLGLFFIYAHALQWLMRKYPRTNRAIYCVAGLILATFGMICFQQNKIWQNGETLWTHVLKYYPGTALVWENRASYYGEAGRVDEALQDYDKAIALNPRHAPTYASRANQYLYSDAPDKYESALQDLNLAVSLSPESAEYRFRRAKVLLHLGRLDQALRDTYSAGQLQPGRPDLLPLRSQIHFKRGDYDKARSDLDSYLLANPGDASMWSNLGTVLRLDEKYRESLNAYDTAIQLNPDDLDYYYKRSMTHYMMGSIQFARRDFNHAKSRGFNNINPAFEKLLAPGTDGP
jgi:tetratricopeptide (TPR) repeat protein